MTDDAELLRRYARDRSEAAFAELVRRHIDLVYSATLRRVGHDRHLADDIVQEVFRDLARKAPTLLLRPNLAGWLYISARYAAATAVRSEQHRRTREREANLMSETDNGPQVELEQLQPILEESIEALNPLDREVVLLRFFEKRQFADIGAILGLSEDAAQKRVARALDKLRAIFASRGITSTAAALGTTLAAQTVSAAPAGLAALATSTSIATPAGVGVSSAALTIMTTTKLLWGTLTIATAVGLGSYLFTRSGLTRDSSATERQKTAELAELRAENLRLRVQVREVSFTPPPAMSPAPAPDLMARPRAVAKLIASDLIGPVNWGLGSPSDIESSFVKLTGLFGLTAADSDALRVAGMNSKSEMLAATLANSRVLRSADQLTLSIPDLPAARASFDRMIATIAEVLGPDRYALSEQIGFTNSLKEQLGVIGLEASEISVVRRDTPPDQSQSYRVERTVSLPEGGRKTVATGIGNGRDFISKSVFGPFASILPGDF